MREPHGNQEENMSYRKGLSVKKSLSVIVFKARNCTIASNSLSSKPTYSLLIIIVHGGGLDLSTFLEC